MGRPLSTQSKSFSPAHGGKFSGRQKSLNSPGLFSSIHSDFGDDFADEGKAPDIATQMSHAAKYGHSFAKTALLQRQAEDQEEELERKPESLQRQGATGEDEDDIQPKADDDSLLQPKAEEEDDLQPKPEEEETLSPKSIQTKLTIGQPGDKYEQEADRTAAQVMQMPEPRQGLAGFDDYGSSVSRKSNKVDEEDKSLQQRQGTTPLIHRQPIGEFEKPNKDDSLPQLKPSLQTKGTGKSAPQGFEQRLNQHRGGGQPLPDGTRSFMESRFGADFGGVRVHEAPQEAADIGTQAFTHGQDIYFNAGKYNPGSSSGKELLAHELTHTIQQTGGKLQPKANKISLKLSSVSNKDLQAKATIQLRESAPAEESPAPDLEGPQAANTATPAPPESEGQVEETTPLEETSAPTNPEGQENAAGVNEGATPSVQNAGGESAGGENTAEADSTGGVASTEAPAEGGVTETPASVSGAEAAGPETEEATISTAPQSPEEDPGFQAVVGNVQGVAASEQRHGPAAAEAEAAQSAARSPASEVESQAQNQQVGQMDQQEPGTFDAEAFKSALLSKISAIIPETEEEAKDFGDNNELDSVRSDVSTQVADEQANAAGPIEAATATEPDTSQIEPRTSTPLAPQEVGTPTTEVGAEQATPPPRSDSEVSDPLAADAQAVDQQMEAASISEDQLTFENSGEAEFQSALDAREEVHTHAAEAPAIYRQQEQATLTQTQADAQATSQQQLTAMHGDRATLLNQVVGQQTETQTQDEAERAKVAENINGIYNTTKTDVENILQSLDGDVTTKFDNASSRAKNIFEDYVKRKMDAWEQERYGEFYEITKYDERISDAWHGLPPEVNQFFVDGKQKYIDEMDTALTDIAELVASKLNEAKERIAQGRQEIQDYVTGLPQSLQQYGQEAAQGIQQKFDELEQSVESKQDELIDSLAQRYRDSLQEVNTRIEEMKEANRGLKDKAMDAIGGAIQTILELKDMLMGVLSRAAGAVDKIILDPIEFLGNLIDGVKQGFDNFVGNIWEHLKQGLVNWLTGTLGNAGVQIPETFDLPGIFTMVMQVLGLAYDAIKSRTIRALGKNGERIFSALETTFEIFTVLQSEGIAGLWRFIQDKIGDLKVMVLDAIQNFVIETVIKQGVLWVLSLLNPASAFVKACQMIYNVIIFFVEQGSQIVDLVNAVIESTTSIANGAIGAAATLIEGALSKALPIVIGFMASLLNLGGISDKIREIIETVKAPIDEAIDWLIAQAIRFAKKIGKALGFGSDVEDGEQTDNEEGGELEDSEVGKTIPFNAGDKGHRLWIQTQGTSTEVMVASTPTTVEAKLDEWQARLDSLPEEDQPRAQTLLVTARQQLGTTDQSAQKAAQEMQEAKQDSANEAAIDEAEAADEQTESSEQTLAYSLTELFLIFSSISEEPEPIKDVGEVEVEENPQHEAESLEESNSDTEESISLTKLGPQIPQALIDFWIQQISLNPKNKKRYEGYIDNIKKRRRPAAAQSEKEMAFLRGKYGEIGESDEEVPYLKGRKAQGRPKGHTRPDVKDPTNHLIEVKRYLIKNKSNLIARLRKQIEDRREHLPYDLHRRQAIIIDLRGQEKDGIEEKVILDLKQSISQATKLPIENIEVVTW